MNTNESMSGRVNVVLSDDIYEVVMELAETEQRSQSQMTAILVKEALAARGMIPKKQPPTSDTSSGGKGRGRKGDADPG
jgi:hypothetical protein